MKHPRRQVVAATATVVALLATALLVVPALATPPSGVTTTATGVGRFADIDAKAKTDVNPGIPTELWKARIKTEGSSISMSCRTRSPRAGRSAGTATLVPAW